MSQSIRFFAKEYDGRSYDGNYQAYAALLFPDSTAEIRIYAIPGQNVYPPVSKMVCKGKYIINKDTLRIRFLSASSLFRPHESRYDTTRFAKHDAWNNTSALFLFKEEKIVPLQSLFREMLRVPPAVILAMESTFQHWGYNYTRSKFPYRLLAPLRFAY